MYKALVRSHLDYCDVIYHIPAIQNQPPKGVSLNSLMEKVERVQYQAALAITGTWQGSSRAKLYDELGWEFLSDRRMRRRVLQFHKIVDRKTPDYLREKLPPNRNILIHLEHIFQNFRTRTLRYSNSFFPDTVCSWNNIIRNFENLPTFEVLKRHLLALFCPAKKSTYDLFDPTYYLRYLLQLRVGLSCLRSHKKRHNFVDTPSDKCLCKEGVEDTSHFFLFCPFYASLRTILTASVERILQTNNVNIEGNTVNVYLYGHPLISFSDNNKILISTLEFI